MNLCAHKLRRPYQPESSVGDESDYQSRCVDCGAILRDPPNWTTRDALAERQWSPDKLGSEEWER